METKARILVVDDNIELCEGIKEYLEHEGYAVECANSEKNAIALLQGTKYDVALVDIQLPDISGTDLVKKLSSVSSSMEFIHITAHASLDSAIEAVKQDKVISYETKPIDMERLLSLLEQITRRRMAEEELAINCKNQTLLNKLLKVSLDEISLTEQFDKILNMILSASWMPLLCSGGIFLVEDDPGVLVLKAHKGLQTKNIEACSRIPFGKCLCGRAALSGKVEYAERDDERYEIVYKGIVPRGSYNIPIILDGRVIGVLMLYLNESHKQNEQELVFLEAVVSILASMIKRKRIEEALLLSEKLKSIGTITAGISHEFNNILAIISGNVQLLEETYKDHEKLIDALLTIKKATKDGAEISSKMLGFTKIEIDTAEYASYDISDLIKQSVEFTMPRWKNMAQASGINYDIEMDGIWGMPGVHCNPAELREIFINIINNALDAMPDGGSISFSTWNKDGAVFVSVSDTGKGMTKDVKKKIFDPFFTTRRPEGTGLGLSTSYGIITRHGGKIEVESEAGRGSKFTLQFPVADKADSPEKSPEPEQEVIKSGLHILVVDDEKLICKVLDDFLSRDGHMVRTVDNGAEAILLANKGSYDLVLCDMVMPGVYGYDVIKALNELERRPKVGMITGWSEKLKPMDDDAYKVDFILKKPFDFSEVTRHINNLFNDI